MNRQDREYEGRVLQADAITPDPAQAESELQLSRGILRQRLDENRGKPSLLASLVGITEVAAPIARRIVRDHPYASLSGAALVGAWLAQYRPWRALGGSLLAGVLAREVSAMSLSATQQWLEKRSTPTPEGKEKR